MLRLDQLAALDLTLWLGSGAGAAQMLGVNQSTVTRQRAAVLRLSGLRLIRRLDGPVLNGDLELLRAERVVQQLARLKGFAPLRIDANHASGPWFLNPAPEVPDDWEGRSRDGITLLDGNSLTETLMPCTSRLDDDLAWLSGDALVVRRPCASRFADVQTLH